MHLCYNKVHALYTHLQILLRDSTTRRQLEAMPMVVWKTAGNAMQAGGSLLCIQASRWVVWHVRGAAAAAASLAAAAAGMPVGGGAKSMR